MGHRLRAELNIAVSLTLSVVQGHAVAKEVHHQLLHHVEMLGGAGVHVDPMGEAGEQLSSNPNAYPRWFARPFALEGLRS